MSPSPVCVVGSMNADRYTGLARLPEPGETVLGLPLGFYAGGKGLNQAIAAARCGATVRMCGAVGSDSEGALLRDAMVAAGVDAEYVTTVDDATGAAFVFSLQDAENSIVAVPGANARVRAEDAAAAVRGAGVVLVQLEISEHVAARALREAKRCGAITVLNAAPANPGAWEMLDAVDVLIVNEAEAETLGGVGALRERATVVHTRGAWGLTVYPRGEDAMDMRAFPVAAVDTTGAGDAFCGGFVAAIAQGATLESAAAAGAAAGAITVQHRGAQAPSLSQDAVRQLVGVAALSPAK